MKPTITGMEFTLLTWERTGFYLYGMSASSGGRAIKHHIQYITHTHLTHNIIKHHIQYIPHTHTHVITHNIILSHTHPTHNIIKHHIQYITHHSQHHSLTHINTSLTHTHHSHTPPPHNIIKHHIQYITHTHHSLTHIIRGRMYALASLWRPSGVPWSPPLCRWLLRGRRGTWCTAKGRM